MSKLFCLLLFFLPHVHNHLHDNLHSRPDSQTAEGRGWCVTIEILELRREASRERQAHILGRRDKLM